VKKLTLLSGAISLSLVWACTTSPLIDGEREVDLALSPGDRSPASDTRELPWEVRGDHGETLLPDVYYAENSENQQVMPLTMGGARYQIDRLIYPTIGNASLMVRSDTAARMMFVLRVEPEFLSHLAPTESDDVPPGVSAELQSQLRFGKSDGSDGLAFYLMGRDSRSKTEHSSHVELSAGSGSYRILPSMILIDKVSPYMPEEFKKRRTLRVYFDQAAIGHVPEGFYDTRFEVVKGGKILRDVRAKPIYEYQYNSVRIFDKGPEATGDAYTILNVTDTQVSTGKKFQEMTLQKLKEFVAYVKRTHANGSDKNVKNAAFITFNGDLHNGGSPLSVSSLTVAKTYNSEAQEIIEQLKQLPIPIFLTIGNHDGYGSTGVVPKPIDDDERRRGFFGFDRRPPMEDVIERELAGNPTTWKDFKLQDFKKYSDEMQEMQGGRANNIVVGTHVRRIPSGDLEGATEAASWLDRAWRVGWTPVPASDRNFILYDGFHQWRKTYGPLYYSWTFGKNHYISLNSFELRQHRRTGWGMYTVNYGGWISPVQLSWLDGELDRAQDHGRDILILAHHDPRGGHNGKDYPYYFRQIDFEGMGQSFGNYVNGEIIEKNLCEKIPSWARNSEKNLDCMHDGLQEWMRPDPDFDCRADERIAGDLQGHCDVEKFKLSQPGGRNSWYSGYALLARIAGQNSGKLKAHANLRTLVFGHTHYNSMEMKMEGEELVPATLTLDSEVTQRIGSVEQANPFRSLSDLIKKKGDNKSANVDQLATELDQSGIRKSNETLVMNIEKAGHTFERRIQGTGQPGTKRELAILRSTSNANLTSQKYNGAPMHGFQAFQIYPKPDSRGYVLPQINAVSYYLNFGNGAFGFAGKQLSLDREKPMTASDVANPLNQRFDGK
jgi:hypothetical protein